MVHFGEFIKSWSLRSNSVTGQLNLKIGQKSMENDKIENLFGDILGDFQTLWEGNQLLEPVK